jgi:hypothetical protein
MQRRLIFGLLAVVTIWACDSATPSQPGTQAELSVVPVSVSAAPAIATVNEAGLVTAVLQGSTDVLATYDGVLGIRTITVTQN